VRLGIVILVLALVGIGGADGAERPGGDVGSAIVRGLPAADRADLAKVPGGCLALDIRLSTNGRWSSVASVVTPTLRCERYGRDGTYILKKSPGGWRLAYLGSDLPPCSLGVPRDLVRQCRRT
jgi:hypothetical protein